MRAQRHACWFPRTVKKESRKPLGFTKLRPDVPLDIQICELQGNPAKKSPPRTTLKSFCTAMVYPTLSRTEYASTRIQLKCSMYARSCSVIMRQASYSPCSESSTMSYFEALDPAFRCWNARVRLPLPLNISYVCTFLRRCSEFRHMKSRR